MRKIQRAIFFLTPGILMRFLAKKCENIAKSRQKMIPAAADFVLLGRLHLRLLQMCLLSVWRSHILPLDHQVPINSMIQFHLKWWMGRPRWISWMRGPTGDQEVAGSTPAEVGNILSWRLIMKYFLR